MRWPTACPALDLCATDEGAAFARALVGFPLAAFDADRRHRKRRSPAVDLRPASGRARVRRRWSALAPPVRQQPDGRLRCRSRRRRWRRHAAGGERASRPGWWASRCSGHGGAHLHRREGAARRRRHGDAGALRATRACASASMPATGQWIRRRGETSRTAPTVLAPARALRRRRRSGWRPVARPSLTWCACRPRVALCRFHR